MSSLSFMPQYQAPSSWWEHVPVAQWLIEKQKPDVVVELGTHYGVSFFSMCEAAAISAPDCFLYAIDTWKGDSQAGNYNESVYNMVNAHHHLCHKQRSRLVRSTFMEAAEHFPECSIDLLHIDGLHTYSAVKEDFDTWLPKMKENGTILFHDWNVREGDFGVWRLWEEVKADSRFSCVEIANGHGLGIATLSAAVPSWHEALRVELPYLTCKGALLDQLSILREQLEEVERQLDISERHAFNLESKVSEQKESIELLASRLNQSIRIFDWPQRIKRKLGL